MLNTLAPVYEFLFPRQREMAKWGEGDPRWKVEERNDGHNVNGWHWYVNTPPWGGHASIQGWSPFVRLSPIVWLGSALVSYCAQACDRVVKFSMKRALLRSGSNWERGVSLGSEECGVL